MKSPLSEARKENCLGCSPKQLVVGELPESEFGCMLSLSSGYESVRLRGSLSAPVSKNREVSLPWFPSGGSDWHQTTIDIECLAA